MTNVEFALMRRVHVLEEAAKRRALTTEEREFLRRTSGIFRRLAEEEQKSVPRGRA